MEKVWIIKSCSSTCHPQLWLMFREGISVSVSIYIQMLGRWMKLGIILYLNLKILKIVIDSNSSYFSLILVIRTHIQPATINVQF